MDRDKGGRPLAQEAGLRAFRSNWILLVRGRLRDVLNDAKKAWRIGGRGLRVAS